MRLALSAALVAAVLTLPGSAWAAPPFVFPVVCGTNGGHAQAPAGTPVTIQDGWAATTRHLDAAFIGSQTTWISVNGGRRVSLTHHWPEPVDTGQGAWVTRNTYPTGITLGVGQTLRFRYVTTLWRSVFDGWSVFPAGTLTDVTCVVTGA